MPQRRMNSLKSRAMHCGPLSEMIRSFAAGYLSLAGSRIPKPGHYNHLKPKKRAWQFRSGKRSFLPSTLLSATAGHTRLQPIESRLDEQNEAHKPYRNCSHQENLSH
jgi:hypothetical protein